MQNKIFLFGRLFIADNSDGFILSDGLYLAMQVIIFAKHKDPAG
jgi:hypothetical protein